MGLELADSYCFNPHKWMFTNFDCDCFYVADRAALIKTLSILPEYLRNQATESGAVIDYRDWHVPLGRRFRALKLWFVIRHYGVEGLRYHIRRHVAARPGVRRLGARLTRASSWRSAAPSNLVCFRHKGGDALNQATDGAAERQRRTLPDPHPLDGQAHVAPLGRPDLDRGAPRGGGLEEDPGGGSRTGESGHEARCYRVGVLTMSKVTLIDSWPAFPAFWERVRNLPMDEQIAAWAADYVAPWPELLEKQQRNYAGEGEDWRQVAAEYVFPDLDQRFVALERAHDVLQREGVQIAQRAQEGAGF